MSQHSLPLSATDVESDPKFLPTPVDMSYDDRTYPYQFAGHQFCHSPDRAAPGGSPVNCSPSHNVAHPDFYQEGRLIFFDQAHCGRVDPCGADSFKWTKHGYENFLPGHNGIWPHWQEYQEGSLLLQRLSSHEELQLSCISTSETPQGQQTVDGRSSATVSGSVRAFRDHVLNSSYSEASRTPCYPSTSTVSDSQILSDSPAEASTFFCVPVNAQLPGEAYAQYYSGSGLSLSLQHTSFSPCPDVPAGFSGSSDYSNSQDRSHVPAYSQPGFLMGRTRCDDNLGHCANKDSTDRWAASSYDHRYPYPQSLANYPTLVSVQSQSEPIPQPSEQRRYTVALHNSPPCAYSYPRFTETESPLSSHVHAPQPHPWPMLPPPAVAEDPSLAIHGSMHSGVSSAPTVTHSLPLVEYNPKKPLTLACFFCRRRKIACVSPLPQKKDRTCNQCAHRSLKCVYPDVSRRGMRQKLLYNKDPIPVVPPLLHVV
ncbi:hypothetical protein SCP_1502210 [Sparassis crispa]|uniref:Zn(2)-C6 fungal-type domain-containing protein n=1 Tax=Sparassis crispa TaxID=139825 RepID=A0A401H483_9APHY|nr:hypothetical protein SCP_1502210 [Sparassis crispa]GBE89213.1 hypothetical protein SCP_1502210 [Sparassis crispa]